MLYGLLELVWVFYGTHHKTQIEKEAAAKGDKNPKVPWYISVLCQLDHFSLLFFPIAVALYLSIMMALAFTDNWE